MSFPAYETYTESGVEWLGRVPTEWQVVPLKGIAKVVNGYPFDAKLFDPTEGYPLVRIRDLNQTVADTRYNGPFVEAASIDTLDVLIGMDGDFNVGRWLGSERALLNQRMCRVRASTPMITRYLEYVLPTPLKAINDVTYSTTVKHLSSFDVLKIRVAMPESVEDIATVVRFLDRETAKIDALVAEQQKLIDLLKEKRQAVISHAVIKGLDPSVPMKESGIGWLGRLPSHWGVIPLKRDLILLTSGSRGWAAHYADDGSLFIRIGNLTRDDIALDLNEVQRVEVPAGEEGERTKLQGGDLLFSITAYLGSVAVVPNDLEAAYVSQHVALGRLRQQMLLPPWVAYVTKSSVGATFLETQGYGGTKVQLALDDVANIPMPVPPLGEQERIIRFLRDETARLDALVQEARLAMNLLQERRSALISAAITGKIDVRGAVAAEPA